MAEPDFWGSQEKAQATVEERKSLTSITAPLDEAIKRGNDLAAMIEMATEDPSFAEEVPGEVAGLETLVEQLKLKA